MPVIVDCEICSRKLRVPDDLMGQQVKCPTCGHTFRSGGAPSSQAEQEPMPATQPMRSASPDHRSSEEAGAVSGSSHEEDRPAADESGPAAVQPRPTSVPKVPPLDPTEQRSRPGGGFGFVVVGQGKADPPAPNRRPPTPLPDRDDRSRGPLGHGRECRFCGEPISGGAPRCSHCGRWIGEHYDNRNPWDAGLPQRRDVEPHRGGLVLTLGILSLALSPLFIIAWMFGLAAWIMGQRDLARMNSGIVDNEGYGTTQAGWICGIIGTILCGIPSMCCAGWFLFLFLKQ